MESIITKGVILAHNEGAFFIEAKVIDGFVNLLTAFFEGVDAISIPYHSTSVMKRNPSLLFIRPFLVQVVLFVWSYAFSLSIQRNLGAVLAPRGDILDGCV